jgi:hypothetical protein
MLGGGGGSLSPSTPRRPDVAKRFSNRLTASLIFGLIGMLTGALSLVLTWRLSVEEAAVVLTAYPTASAVDLTHEGLGLRVELVNESLRPVIVRGASLWADREKLSEGVGFLEDVNLLDVSNVDPAAVSRGRRNFPITLNAREGRTVAVLMDVWRPVLAASSPARSRDARSRLNHFLTQLSGLSVGREAIELRLDHEPGGSRSFAVRRVTPPDPYPEAIQNASAIDKQAPFQIWLVSPLAKGKVLAGLQLRRTFAGTGQVNLVRLDVWREGSLLHRSFTRPVVGRQSTLFPLPALARGRYTATFRIDGTVVAYRSFVVPWRPDRCGPPVRAVDALPPAWCERQRVKG